MLVLAIASLLLVLLAVLEATAVKFPPIGAKGSVQILQPLLVKSENIAGTPQSIPLMEALLLQLLDLVFQRRGRLRPDVTLAHLSLLVGNKLLYDSLPRFINRFVCSQISDGRYNRLAGKGVRTGKIYIF